MQNLQIIGDLTFATDLDGKVFGWSSGATVIMTPASLKLKSMQNQIDAAYEMYERQLRDGKWAKCEDGDQIFHDYPHAEGGEYKRVPEGIEMPSPWAIRDGKAEDPRLPATEKDWEVAVERMLQMHLDDLGLPALKTREAQVKLSMDENGAPVVYVHARQSMGDTTQNFWFWMSTH
jgi:hypothetical protein